jgi:hypothetical protein
MATDKSVVPATRQDMFTALRDRFLLEHGQAREELQKALIAEQQPLTDEWRAALRTLPQYCVECHKEHLPSASCVPCEFSLGFLHAPMPEGIYFNYRGWRWTPPFICMGCGVEVCHQQWAFSRSCGPCDVSNSRTRRLLYRKCFVGPHEKLSTWSAEQGDIPEDHFVDPKDRMNYPCQAMK